MGKASNDKEYEFKPRSENVFFAKNANLRVTFNSNDNGQVVSMTLLAGGIESVCPKL